MKRAFLDNLYLTVFPRKANSVNGSDWIRNHPELSAALKQCARLRKQFLPYFTEGTFIGNCILTEWPNAAAVSAYVLPDKLLMIVMNEGAEREITIKLDIAQWLVSPSHRYEMKVYDNNGGLIHTKELSSRTRTLTTPWLRNMDFAIYEFAVR